MRIMGVSGLAGSGKSFVSELATKRGAMIISMGDIIREEAKKRGESTGETAENLRKEHGQYIVAELTVKKIKKLLDEGLDKSIVVEGIRSPYEVTMFKENFSDFIILSIFANQEIRFERIKARKREDDATNFDEFKIREDRELNFGIGDVVSLSDKIIINESDLDSYLIEIENFLEEYNI
jgi:dephospho-CoA kinase